MIELKLKPCCYTCDFPDIEVDNRYVGSFLDKTEITLCHVYCNHSKVCKKFIESEETK